MSCGSKITGNIADFNVPAYEGYEFNPKLSGNCHTLRCMENCVGCEYPTISFYKSRYNGMSVGSTPFQQPLRKEGYLPKSPKMQISHKTG